MPPDSREAIDALYRESLPRSFEDRAKLLASADPDVRREVEERLTREAMDAETVQTPAETTTSPGTPASLMPGTQIGDYQIEAPLGAGGMGEVYKAHDTKLGRDVAIKTLPSGLREDAELLERFRQEGRMLAALNHPNIAAIHDLKEWAGGSFLVLELVEGETLDERLRRTGRMSAVDALGIAIQGADALDAAQARGITHRDIKPSNSELTPAGTVKVLDFGPEKDKKLALFETGHVVYPGPEMIKEVLDWFDRYLGPVRLQPAGAASGSR